MKLKPVEILVLAAFINAVVTQTNTGAWLLAIVAAVFMLVHYLQTHRDEQNGIISRQLQAHEKRLSFNERRIEDIKGECTEIHLKLGELEATPKDTQDLQESLKSLEKKVAEVSKIVSNSTLAQAYRPKLRES